MAATATFDLSLSPGQSTNHGSLPLSFSLTEGGVTANFSAGAFTDYTAPISGSNRIFTSVSLASDPRIGRYDQGAGVVNSPTDNDHQVDGSGWADFILIDFGQDVTITSISFGLFGRDDDFRWMYDSNNDNMIGVGDFLSFLQDDNPFSGFGGTTSNLFAIGAFDSDDEWKLKTVSIEYTAPVPLPAGGLLLLSALGGVAALRRRRKAA
ncbi:MAG: hypothetical protein CVT80_10870 [Alphaproteobacteria bacterium HGW-Alphaproteobacteria-2]|nr:MAG: hypothetical protein CVT80_10870 [Alphaproteobacteria bacterium HGW-Alphaproteobacteria-2]